MNKPVIKGLKRKEVPDEPPAGWDLPAAASGGSWRPSFGPLGHHGHFFYLIGVDAYGSISTRWMSPSADPDAETDDTAETYMMLLLLLFSLTNA